MLAHPPLGGEDGVSSAMVVVHHLEPRPLACNDAGLRWHAHMFKRSSSQLQRGLVGRCVLEGHGEGFKCPVKTVHTILMGSGNSRVIVIISIAYHNSTTKTSPVPRCGLDKKEKVSKIPSSTHFHMLGKLNAQRTNEQEPSFTINTSSPLYLCASKSRAVPKESGCQIPANYTSVDFCVL